MPRTDAFGNPIGEQSVSVPTGGSPTPAPTQTPPTQTPPTPPLAPTALPGADAPPAPPTAPRRRRVGGGAWAAFLLFDLVVVGVVAGVFLLNKGTHSLENKVLNSAPAIQRPLLPTVGDTTPEPATPAKPASPPRGLASGSLLRPGGVRLAIRRAGRGQIRLLRLAPDRANLQLVVAGRLRMVQVGYDGARSVVTTPAVASSQPGVRRGAIDAGAPARLVRAAAHRLGRHTSSVDYLVLMNDGAGLGVRWAVYFTGGGSFLADAHGRITQRIS
jgi:hypothetical protein